MDTFQYERVIYDHSINQFVLRVFKEEFKSKADLFSKHPDATIIRII